LIDLFWNDYHYYYSMVQRICLGANFSVMPIFSCLLEALSPSIDYFSRINSFISYFDLIFFLFTPGITNPAQLN